MSTENPSNGTGPRGSDIPVTPLANERRVPHEDTEGNPNVRDAAFEVVSPSNSEQRRRSAEDERSRRRERARQRLRDAVLERLRRGTQGAPPSSERGIVPYEVGTEGVGGGEGQREHEPDNHERANNRRNRNGENNAERQNHRNGSEGHGHEGGHSGHHAPKLTKGEIAGIVGSIAVIGTAEAATTWLLANAPVTGPLITSALAQMGIAGTGFSLWLGAVGGGLFLWYLGKALWEHRKEIPGYSILFGGGGGGGSRKAANDNHPKAANDNHKSKAASAGGH